MRKLRDRMASKRGFSMAELMICLLILLLSTGVGVQVIDSSIEHYQESSRTSEAITLNNTIAVALRDQLAFVTSVRGGRQADAGVEDAENRRFQPAFVSTANTLENIPCEIVTLDDEGRVNAAGRSPGYVALRYTVEQADGSYGSFDYYPVKKQEYDKGIASLAAIVDYNYNLESKQFEVTITIEDRNTRIVERTDNFVVSPVDESVTYSASAR